MTRLNICRLDEIIRNPVLGPGEIRFVRAFMLVQVRIAHEEIGDTLDTSDDLITTARVSAGIDGVFIRQDMICSAVASCLANRFLGNCALGNCDGSKNTTEFIDEITEELGFTRGNKRILVAIDAENAAL